MYKIQNLEAEIMNKINDVKQLESKLSFKSKHEISEPMLIDKKEQKDKDTPELVPEKQKKSLEK